MSLRTIALWACLLIASVSCAETYQVQKGDNDHVIARKIGISVIELHRLNPDTDWRKLQIGDTLKTSASKPVAKSKSKKESLARALKASGTYKVTAGESDYSIAHKFGISISQLKGLNPDVSFDPLKLGATLKVPAAQSRAVSNVTKPAAKPVAKPVSKPAPPAVKDANVNLIKTPNAVVSKDLATIRQTPRSDGRKMALADKGAVGEIVGREGNWYKLRFSNNKQGWIRGDLLGETAKVTSAHVASYSKPAPKPIAKSTGTTVKSSAAASSLIDTAMGCLGIRYVWGGTSRSGFDCSGFVGHVFRRHGISLPRTAGAQWNVGTPVARGSLAPGDLVFFRTRGSRVSHVGISLGGSRFIHASSGSGQIRINELSGYYSNRYAGARRVLKGSVVASAVYEYDPVSAPPVKEPSFDPDPIPATPKSTMGSDVITK